MIELDAIAPAAESRVSPQRLSVVLPPKKRWKQKPMEVVPVPVSLPTPSPQFVRTRMKRSGQPHRIYPTVLTKVTPAAKSAMRLSIFSFFPWKEGHS